jgi:hypothetical protein
MPPKVRMGMKGKAMKARSASFHKRVVASGKRKAIEKGPGGGKLVASGSSNSGGPIVDGSGKKQTAYKNKEDESDVEEGVEDTRTCSMAQRYVYEQYKNSGLIPDKVVKKIEDLKDSKAKGRFKQVNDDLKGPYVVCLPLNIYVLKHATHNIDGVTKRVVDLSIKT